MRSSPWRSATALATCAAFLAALVWPNGARAQEPPPQAAPAAQPAAAPASQDQQLAQAKGWFEAGKNAYTAGDYRGAIRDFKYAARLRPSPILDYNIALAQEKLNHPRVAVKYYQRYLSGMPNASNRAEVEAKIAALNQQIAAAPPAPAPAPEPETNQPPPPAPQQYQYQTQPASSYPTYGTYDPYATSAPAQPVRPVKKKRSLWWLAIVIPVSVLFVVGIIAVAVVYSADTATVTAADRGLMMPPRAPPESTNPSQRTPGVGPILFRF